MKYITIKNCTEVMHEMPLTGDLESQAKAWRLIYQFCVQQGMPMDGEPMAGIERVIRFISNRYETKENS